MYKCELLVARNKTPMIFVKFYPSIPIIKKIYKFSKEMFVKKSCIIPLENALYLNLLCDIDAYDTDNRIGFILDEYHSVKYIVRWNIIIKTVIKFVLPLPTNYNFPIDINALRATLYREYGEKISEWQIYWIASLQSELKQLSIISKQENSKRISEIKYELLCMYNQIRL